MHEDELKKIVKNILAEHFVIQEEVRGSHLISGEKVIIDFLIFPKPTLTDRGFEEFWIGLEVKSPRVKEADKNGLKLAWQAITYSHSEFDEIKPALILVYPPIMEFFPEITVLNETNGKNHKYNEGYNVARLLQRANVGDLKIYKNNEWSISFASMQYYFSSNKGRGNVKNVGFTKQIGSTRRS